MRSIHLHQYISTHTRVSRPTWYAKDVLPHQGTVGDWRECASVDVARIPLTVDCLHRCHDNHLVSSPHSHRWCYPRECCQCWRILIAFWFWFFEGVARLFWFWICLLLDRFFFRFLFFTADMYDNYYVFNSSNISIWCELYRWEYYLTKYAWM